MSLTGRILERGERSLGRTLGSIAGEPARQERQWGGEAVNRWEVEMPKAQGEIDDQRGRFFPLIDADKSVVLNQQLTR